MSSELPAALPGDQVVVLRRSMEDFCLLVQRFEHLAIQETELADLHKRQIQEMVRAGRLFVEVVDAGGFPESRKEENHGWWDRACGRIPAGPFLFLNQMKGESGNVKFENGIHVNIQLNAEDEHGYMEAVKGTWSPSHYSCCWPSVISWLVTKFPVRFTHDAISFFGNNILTKGGVPVDGDGQPIPVIYSVNGVEQPVGFEPLPLSAYPEGTEVSWARKLVTEADVFTEANTMSKFRGMARANADGCRLIAHLVCDVLTDSVGPQTIDVSDTSSQKAPRSKSSGRKLGTARKLAIKLMDSGELPDGRRNWKQLLSNLKNTKKAPQDLTEPAFRAAVLREEEKRRTGARNKPLVK